MLENIVDLLLKGEKLPIKNYNHALQGSWKGYRECHIQPDWLLIYLIEKDILTLISTGSHSDLFKM